MTKHTIETLSRGSCGYPDVVSVWISVADGLQRVVCFTPLLMKGTSTSTGSRKVVRQWVDPELRWMFEIESIVDHPDTYRVVYIQPYDDFRGDYRGFLPAEAYPDFVTTLAHAERDCFDRKRILIENPKLKRDGLHVAREWVEPEFRITSYEKGSSYLFGFAMQPVERFGTTDEHVPIGRPHETPDLLWQHLRGIGAELGQSDVAGIIEWLYYS